ncbi:MAG: hypothetical protein AABY64_13580 [Bdellovibrionota bacterium]
MKKENKKQNDIIERAKQRRIKVSLTFDPGTYHAFQGTCEKQGVVASRVLEELMKDFVDKYDRK